jgi:hypothetical protein
MRPVRELFLRACALTAAVLGAAFLAGPGCALINSSSDCSPGCNILKSCGLLPTNDCGVYCASVASGAVFAGCSDQLEAQSTCAKQNPTCSSPSPCAGQIAAFAKCMQSYCDSNPNGQGCAGGGDGGTGDGGTSEGGTGGSGH